MHVADVREDLIAEQNALDTSVSGCDEAIFDLPTDSPGWTVADQIAHLAYFDNAAAVAITKPDQFKSMVDDLWEHAAKGGGAVDDFTLGSYRVMTPAELTARWRADRASLAEASRSLADDNRVIWYGPSMGSKSFLTARLMECWAHGQDVAAAAGLTVEATDRLSHIARLGVITRGWSYINRGLEPPEGDVRVELTSPSGGTWEFGPEGAGDHVGGSAVDFCRVVTQRVHLADTELSASPGAREWLLIAQAFAGPPTDGPAAS
jgi:uncharacterized protein (TIGR03084 family)